MVKATFPHGWFEPDAESTGSTDENQTSATAGQRARHAPSSASITAPQAAKQHSDLDRTGDLTRQNSFDFVMDMAKRAEAAAVNVNQTEELAKPTRTASRTTQDNRTYVQRRPLPGPAAPEQAVEPEQIELSNLPQFTRSGHTGRNAPSTPPPAHLPRR
ncbi:hypothetical protein LTR17_013820 [Elasticomyces elasticus]|nr:hypothetical protein LTR17_013820 [Elasticomyces elasticus]